MGGHAIKSASSILQRQVHPTYLQVTTLLRDMHVKETCMIGSTGKTPTSGDIDIAVSLPKEMTRKDLFVNLRKIMSPDDVVMPGNIISLRYPIYDTQFKQTAKHVQVDLIVGNIDYLKWARYGPSVGESLAKGSYRNALLNTVSRYASADIFGAEKDRNVTRYILDFNEGLFLAKKTKNGVKGPRKTWKTLEKTLISINPYEICEILLETTPDLSQTLESVVHTIKMGPKYRKRSKQMLEAFIKDISTATGKSLSQPVEQIKEIIGI